MPQFLISKVQDSNSAQSRNKVMELCVKTSSGESTVTNCYVAGEKEWIWPLPPPSHTHTHTQ